MQTSFKKITADADKRSRRESMPKVAEIWLRKKYQSQQKHLNWTE